VDEKRVSIFEGAVGGGAVTAVLLLGGLLVLSVGAEFLVRGASGLARRWGVPSLVVGLTVVAFGTSAPEMVVSIQGALNGQSGLALGNVVGSNIFNVLFILGLCALLAPLVVARPVIWREVPLMIAASAFLWGLAADGRVSRIDGVLLVLLLAAYTTYQVREGLRQGHGDTTPETWSLGRCVVSVFGGLGALVLGARWFLEGSVQAARALGLSELVIGLTIVAAGTSLPEVVTSLVATWRGQRDIAVGNVVGSNIFNILGVLGLAAVLAPGGIVVERSALAFDIPVMSAVAVATLPIFFSGHLIARWEGLVFLFYYAVYTAFLILKAVNHDALPLVNGWMLWFAVPLTLLTLIVSVHRHVRRHGWKGPAQ
jgi:cation:H+ antiporter